MSIKRIHIPKNTPSPMYSDGVIFGDILSISGMLPVDKEGDVVGKGDAAAQAEQVFQNIKAVLEAADATFAQVVKLNIYLTDIEYRSAIMPVRQKYFGERKPSSTLLEISRLANPDALLEVEAMVYLGDV